MKKGNRPTELSTENFFNLQKGTKENNTQPLRKNYNSNKNHMGAWDNCLFVVVVCVTCKQRPAAHWVRSQALQLSVCTAGLCVAPRTLVNGGRLEVLSLLPAINTERDGSI